MRLKTYMTMLFLIFSLAFSPVLFYLPVSANDFSDNRNIEGDQHFSWDNATVYFAMTDRFYDGNPDNNQSYGRPQVDATGQNIGTFHGGDLQGLTDKLNEGYFFALGVNAIWITAPYEQIHGWVGGGSAGDFAHYAFHGYYALDYTMIDQNMGKIEEMREFVDTAHGQGIRVVLDVVMNHPGYNTLADMHQYGFGDPNVSDQWTPSSGQTWHDVHDYINYDHASAWTNWWGNWVRAGIEGYERCGNSEHTMCLAGLPDFRTDVRSDIGLPPLLVNKWNGEESGQYDEWILPSATQLRTDLGIAPADYISKWLAAWVEEFGIDGFRVDTAKHVELDRWQQLKDEANEALWNWREKNSDAPGAQWEDDFWMTAEVWGHGVGKSEYFNYGFDSVINFTFQGEGGNGPAYDLNSMENTFSSYANQINTDSAFNVLSYISQHDTHLYPRDNLIEGGTFLMLLPGAVKVFYGDETARPFGPTGSDPHQGTRSSMNWDSINEDVLFHWQKMGQFRNRHIAIGAGEHQQISEAPYTFSRIYEDDEISDEVVVSVGANGKTTINVSSVFTDGEVVRDFYTDETATVINGEVTFNANDHGVILVEREGAALPNVSASPEGGEFEDESIDVTLHLQRAEVGAYTIDGSDPNTNGTSYGNGDTITLGTDVEVGESVTLRLHAENDAGSVEEEYIFTKVPSYAQVGADPPGGDFTGESIEVTLYAKNVNVASYSLNGVEVEYFDGDQIIIGENIEPGESMVLSLFAENEFGKAEEQYTYTKVDGLTIYFKKPQNWGTPHLYFYGTEPEIDEPTWTEAPEMEWVTGDWYSYKIEGTESAYVIFKDQDNQWPGSGQPGFFRDADGWFDGKWHDDNPEQPTIPQAPKNLRANQVTIDSVSLEWDTPDQQVDYYAIYRNGERIAESEIATFVDENLESSTAYIYYVVAVNPLGESSASEEFEIRTRDNEDSNKLTIYYQGFDQAYIHYKIGNSSWTTAPGEKMSLSSFENHHVITIDLDHEEELTAAFNNGRGQWDNNQGADYSFTSGIYTVKNGHVVEGAPDSVINDEKVTIYYYTNWDYPRIHYALSDGEWTAVPGVAMSRFHDYPEYAVITLNLGTANRLKAAFNNSFGSWDSNEGRDYEFAKGIYTLRNGQIFNGTPNNNFY